MLNRKNSRKSLKLLYSLSLPLLCLMLIVSACQGRETESDQSNPELVPFGVIDQVPVFPGCEDAEDKRACFNEKIQRHIQKNFSYPQEALQKGIEGRVAVMFIIDKEGNITSIQEKGPDPLLEAEVHRIIARLPKMKPGLQGEEAVNVPFSIPVMFKLN